MGNSQSGINNNNYKGGPKQQLCNYCGSYFIPNNPYAKRKYCSHKCSTNTNIGKPVSENVKNTFKKYALIKIEKSNINPKKICVCGHKKDIKSKLCLKCHKKNVKRKITKLCPNCNKEFINKSVIKYCSKLCYKEHLKTKYLADKNPNWEGGVKTINQIGRYTKDYVDWRNFVFQRDKFTCQKCGQIGNKLHAHHIKKWSKFKELRLDTDNGITLCIKCHKLEHSRFKASLTVQRELF